MLAAESQLQSYWGQVHLNHQFGVLFLVKMSRRFWPSYNWLRWFHTSFANYMFTFPLDFEETKVAYTLITNKLQYLLLHKILHSHQQSLKHQACPRTRNISTKLYYSHSHESFPLIIARQFVEILGLSTEPLIWIGSAYSLTDWYQPCLKLQSWYWSKRIAMYMYKGSWITWSLLCICYIVILVTVY